MPKERPINLSAGDALPLGSRIRLRRLSRGIRLSAMAKAIGYDRGYLSHVENNEVTPSVELVEKIAQYLEVSVQDLKQGPIAQLAPGYGVTSGEPLGGAFILTAPPTPPRPRTLAQRLQRILSMAHLTEEEEAIVADYLVATTQAALALVKSTRQLKSKGTDKSDEED
jgi:transcriptional regulator with XRE-family HTH domain